MKPLFVITICVSALMAASSPAAAQAQRPERPYRGLFGGGVGDVEQSLIWNASTGAGYDDDVLAQEGISSDPRNAQAGNFGSFSTGLSYSYSKPRLSIGMSGDVNGRYMPNSSDEFYAGYGGSAGLSFDIWQGARFTGTQSATYQPYFALDLSPSLQPPALGAPVVQDPAFAGVVGEDYLSYTTNAGLSQKVSRRGSLSFSYNQQVSEFESASGDFTSRSVNGLYSHNVAKGLALRAGYGYTESDSDSPDGGESASVQSIDAGVDFNRALSFSRRTTLSFSTGSSGVSDDSGPHYYFTGSAQLRREIGRSWLAAAGASRSVQFIDALRRPILSDAFGVDIGGLFSRRLQFNSHAGVSFGQSAISGADDFDTYLASAGVSYGITRYVALDVNYSFYRYKFHEGAVVPPGFTQEQDRQGIHASLSLWAPMFQRARRPDAAR